MDKYFTPSIEDLHKGYECEIRQRLKPLGIYAQIMQQEEEFHKFFTPVEIGKTYDIPDSSENELTLAMLEAVINNYNNQNPSVDQAANLLKKGMLRTPYLTSEKISNEGWGFEASACSDYKGTRLVQNFFTKGKYSLFFNFNDKKVKITYNTGGNDEISVKLNGMVFITKPGIKTLYDGDCKCINQLRIICKLLNI